MAGHDEWMVGGSNDGGRVALLATHFQRNHTVAMEAPEVRFARSGDVSIAYAVVGNGPFDLVFVTGWVLSVLEAAWDGPAVQLLTELASFSRLILFDKRGTGLSDQTTGIPDLETRMDDIRAVMDAAGSRRAAVLGVSEGGPMTMLFAASHPDRTAAVVLYGTGASWVKSSDYPWGATTEEWAEDIAAWSKSVGSQAWLDERLQAFAPSLVGDPEARQWWRRWVRTSASPAAILALRRMNSEIDVRHVLASVRAPALVTYRVDDGDYPAEGRSTYRPSCRTPGGGVVRATTAPGGSSPCHSCGRWSGS